MFVPSLKQQCIRFFCEKIKCTFAEFEWSKTFNRCEWRNIKCVEYPHIWTFSRIVGAFILNVEDNTLVYYDNNEQRSAFR